ncbi:MAG: 2-oxoacid:acceptor oxidoreductase subunit alpha, partial [Gemmatimonadota bacterium]|nr:2-oxoacid:acceptor oxidoreductase subunit alpha [Gemmatimonadota bacterium]
NRLAIQGGRAYCEATHVFQTTYRVEKAEFPPGKYRNINGNTAMALGLTAAGHRSRLPVFLSTYPITPASDILHEMAKHKRHGVLTIQVEDEIAAICQAIGGAFAGMLAVTTTSGPGMALKSEAMGLAVMAELPLVIVNIQRGGPSTGLPTKTEQADLLQAAYGRHGEAPIPIISARSPGHCFWAAMEGARIAIQYMTPVIILSDGYLANGAEPWKIPSPDELPGIPVKLRTDPEGFRPFDRDPESLARPWAIPGTPGLEHRIGGLEKEDGSGNVSHDPANHQKMVQLRAEKVARIQDSIPDAEVVGDRTGKLLIVSWGSTYGAICGALRRGAENGLQVSHVHVDYLFPFPKNLEELLKGFDKILVPELNLGQLAHMLRAEFLIDVKQYNKVQGKPFKSSEILDAIHRTLEDGE